MKQAPNAISRSFRLLILASACLALPALADDYADVAQLVRASQFSQAMTRVDSYLATKPGDPQMRFLKAVILRHQGKTAQAMTTLTELTQDYPELPEPYNNLAVLYASQGQYDQARQALEMAIRTNRSYATAHENLGDVYARLASQAYNEALKLDGGNTTLAPKLALIDKIFPRAPGNSPSAAHPAANGVEAQWVPLDPEANKAVEVAVLAWAKAWSDKNNVSLTLTGLSIRVQGDQAVAKFRSVDSAGNPSTSSPQILHLKKSGQQWLVTGEAAGL